MHTLHYFAVEADSRIQAVEIIEQFLEDSCNDLLSWSDWWVVGGGRWASNPKDVYADVICHADNPTKFQEILDGIVDGQKESIKSLIESINSNEVLFAVQGLIDSLDERLRLDSLDFNSFEKTKELRETSKGFSYISWKLSKLSNAQLNYYDTDSYFYDFTDGESTFDSLLKRIKTNSAKQFLVPVDFHF